MSKLRVHNFVVTLWNGLAGLHERYAIETVTVPSGATHLFFSR
jgi:hypothetical protein